MIWSWLSGPRAALTFFGFRVAGKEPWTGDYQLGQQHKPRPCATQGTKYETSSLADHQSHLHHVLRGSSKQKEVMTPSPPFSSLIVENSVETLQLQRDNCFRSSRKPLGISMGCQYKSFPGNRPNLVLTSEGSVSSWLDLEQARI